MSPCDIDDLNLANNISKGGRGRGRGGGGSHRPRPDNRVNKADIPRENEKFETYYNQLGVVAEAEKDAFWEAMRRDLPNSFRFTGSRAYVRILRCSYFD